MADGCPKALKMRKIEYFSLNKIETSQKDLLDKKLLKNLSKDVKNILSSFNAYLIEGCKKFKNFSGRDLDALNNRRKYFRNYSNNTIIRDIDNNSVRIHLNSKKNINFLSIDIEETSKLQKIVGNIFEKKFNNQYYCNKTKLFHLEKKGIIFYKILKYFYFGTIHSFSQLLSLKKEIKKLNKKNIKLILDTFAKIDSVEFYTIKKFIFMDFKKFCKSKKIIQFFYMKRLKRHNLRNIYAGKINLKKMILKKKFIYAFLFGSKAKWKSSHNPMPAFTIVGNDGSGKTTITEYIRKNFSKMDPLIFDMKASKPFFGIIFNIRNFLKKLNSVILIKKIFFLNSLISFIGENLDFFDKYIKYKIGMAWADAGYGLTVFERYPTDRIRGEFPNSKSKIFPLEQFFPFPDGMIYLDVTARVSIHRKKKDKHTLSEMTSKRENYLKLIKEFDEVKLIHSKTSFKEKIKNIKDYIFELNKKKKNYIKKNKRVKRLKWKKNLNRELAGNRLHRRQGEGFY